MRAIITVGLGYGDEAKGASVDFLAHHYKAALVVRYSGGAQCGHNVVGPTGKKHPFAQWGAGTFSGVPTYLDREVIVDPLAMRNEAKALVSQGVDEPYELLTVHPDCLVATPIHAAYNRECELARGAEKHGSCGMGIGATREYWLNYGADAIFVRDLKYFASHGARHLVEDKLRLLHQRLALRCPELRKYSFRGLAGDLIAAVETVSFSYSPWSLVLDRRQDATVVFEGAQGILLDEHYGTEPHTTWSDVSPRHALRRCDEYRSTWPSPFRMVVLGVTRTYATRHGAGPLLGSPLTFRDTGNPYNPWQGDIRFATLERLPEACRYVQEVCEEEYAKLDGLVVNCLDEFQFPEELAADEALPPIVMEGRGPERHERRLVKELFTET